MSSITPNTYPLNTSTSISGIYYTITAIGGFDISQNFPKITLAAITPITKYDVTNAVQVIIDVNFLNNKLGSYNSVTNTYQNDTIIITAAEFLQNVSSANQIISVGYLSNIYSDFAIFVNNYFNYSSGVPSIFSSTTPFSYNNGVFDSNAFINIINSHTTDSNGGYIQALSGSIRINNVNNLLKYAHDFNVFGNRSSNPTDGTISNFKDGDLILISPIVSSAATGIRAYLNLNIDTSLVTLPDSNTHYYTTTTGTGTNITVSEGTINNIHVTRYAPLLLILKNM